MGKIYKGWELMKAIANGDIKNGSKFRDLHQSSKDNFNLYKYENENLKGRFGETNLIALLNDEFELIEDEKEVEKIYCTNNNQGMITNSSDDNEKERELRKYIVNNCKDIEEILQVVKQIDKRVKKLEGK